MRADVNGGYAGPDWINKSAPMRKAACLAGWHVGVETRKGKEKSISSVKVYFVLMTVYNCILLLLSLNFFHRKDAADLMQNSAGRIIWVRPDFCCALFFTSTSPNNF